jgi:hypothetical protein
VGEVEPKTTPWWVCFQKVPYWTLGESSDTVWSRRKIGLPVADAQRYPNDYAGRIVSVVDGRQPRPGWTHGETADCVLLDLTPGERADAASKKSKFNGVALVPITVEDEYGAVAEVLLSKYSAADLVDSKEFTDELTEKSIKVQRDAVDRSSR